VSCCWLGVIPDLSLPANSENVRDVSFGEDASTTRAGHAATNLATIRSRIINLLRQSGYR
jgi:predicted transposase YbfD/YdcC